MQVARQFLQRPEYLQGHGLYKDGQSRLFGEGRHADAQLTVNAKAAGRVTGGPQDLSELEAAAAGAYAALA